MKANSLIEITARLLLGCTILITLQADHLLLACGPGRAGGRRRMLRKYPPLVQRQYIPNVSENTLGASGRPEGPIRRNEKRFKELVQNWNQDIEFRDDEGTGADRWMTQRLKEKLSVLAISVMNQWPQVKLRVIEGWDEDHRHLVNSLHYEGRAVDITTSDRDKSKYGMLARLAVEAGFDWVHYESRSHVHCSVKSEKADTIRNNGCFHAKSLVETPHGRMEMSQLQTNDLVLTMNPQSGRLQYSPVIMWLDRDELGQELFVELTTKSGRQIQLTSSHLIYVADEQLPDLSHKQPPPSTATTTLANNHKAKTGNNYYYYETNSQLANESNPTGAGDLAEPSASSKLSPLRGRQQQLDWSPKYQAAANLDDSIFKTYARSVVVGQYLLTKSSAAEDQIKTVDYPKEGAFEWLWSAPGRESRLLLLGRSAPATGRMMVDDQEQEQQLESATTTAAAGSVALDQIVSVNYVSRDGIYAPLTRQGNIVVDSVLASCYAVISDHEMAHLSFAPVRWMSYINQWLFGLQPDTPTEERVLESSALKVSERALTTGLESDGVNSSNLLRKSQRYVQQQKKQTPQSDEHNNYKLPTISTTNGLNRTQQQQLESRRRADVEQRQPQRTIHWYPLVLFNIARFILPNRYLY